MVVYLLRVEHLQMAQLEAIHRFQPLHLMVEAAAVVMQQD
jgi:hypothetical protein